MGQVIQGNFTIGELVMKAQEFYIQAMVNNHAGMNAVLLDCGIMVKKLHDDGKKYSDFVNYVEKKARRKAKKKININEKDLFVAEIKAMFEVVK